MIDRDAKLPWWEKHLLTIDEGSQYFGIGEGALRMFLREHEGADYMVAVGTKVLIKRDKFAEFINSDVGCI